MTIEITVEELVASQEAFIELNKIKLKNRLSYLIARVERKLLPEFKTFFDNKNALVIKYGKEDKDGNTIINSKDKENYKLFSDELQALYECKITLNIDMIDISLFDEVNLEPNIMLPILWLIKDEEKTVNG